MNFFAQSLVQRKIVPSTSHEYLLNLNNGKLTLRSHVDEHQSLVGHTHAASLDDASAPDSAQVPPHHNELIIIPKGLVQQPETPSQFNQQRLLYKFIALMRHNFERRDFIPKAERVMHQFASLGNWIQFASEVWEHCSEMWTNTPADTDSSEDAQFWRRISKHLHEHIAQRRAQRALLHETGTESHADSETITPSPPNSSSSSYGSYDEFYRIVVSKRSRLDSPQRSTHSQNYTPIRILASANSPLPLNPLIVEQWPKLETPSSQLFSIQELQQFFTKLAKFSSTPSNLLHFTTRMTKYTCHHHVTAHIPLRIFHFKHALTEWKRAQELNYMEQLERDPNLSLSEMLSRFSKHNQRLSQHALLLLTCTTCFSHLPTYWRRRFERRLRFMCICLSLRDLWHQFIHELSVLSAHLSTLSVREIRLLLSISWGYESVAKFSEQFQQLLPREFAWPQHFYQRSPVEHFDLTRMFDLCGQVLHKGSSGSLGRAATRKQQIQRTMLRRLLGQWLSIFGFATLGGSTRACEHLFTAFYAQLSSKWTHYLPPHQQGFSLKHAVEQFSVISHHQMTDFIPFILGSNFDFLMMSRLDTVLLPPKQLFLCFEAFLLENCVHPDKCESMLWIQRIRAELESVDRCVDILVELFYWEWLRRVTFAESNQLRQYFQRATQMEKEGSVPHQSSENVNRIASIHRNRMSTFHRVAQQHIGSIEY